MSNHPPKPPFALSCGVVGHRPNRLPEAALGEVASDIAATLAAIAKASAEARERHRDVFAIDPPVLTLVDALAEGADRMAADAGLATGFVLDAPLPFGVDEYEKDFLNDVSRAHYRGLLAQARGVLELPGSRANASQAYERVGITILGLSDLVLAVWDGGAAAGRGGTTSMVMAAVRSGLPVIHVDATGKSRPTVVWTGFGALAGPPETFEGVPKLSLEEGIPRIIDELVRPPSDEDEQKSLATYYGENVHGLSLRIEFPLLQALAFVRALRRSDFGGMDPEGSAHEFRAAAERLGGTPVAASAYGWASSTGGYFSQQFRSAYVSNFIAAALAVISAAASIFFANKTPFAIAETVFIGVVILNTTIGGLVGWHRRWIEGREVAERLRVSTCLWSLALRPSSFYGEEPSWTGWYARAFTRAQPMRSGSLIGDGLLTARAVLLDLLADQCGYNEKTAVRMANLETRLEIFGFVLFVTTFALAGYHLFEEIFLHHEPADADSGLLVTVLCAALPALATASYGIRVIGDFEGAADRAERTHEKLDALHQAVLSDPVDLGRLRARARGTADVMLGDVSSWRLSAESRGLAIPG